MHVWVSRAMVPKVYHEKKKYDSVKSDCGGSGCCVGDDDDFNVVEEVFEKDPV